MASKTPDRLKTAVEDLLLAKGEAGMTLRDITESANANVAAVAYHFSSKDNLVSLVFGEALDEVTNLQVQRVNSLRPNHTLRELIEVWLHPLLAATVQIDREAKLWRIIQRGAAEKSPGLLTNILRAANPVENILLPLLASHLPHLGKAELLFRHNAIVGGLAGLVASPLATSLNPDKGGDQPKEFLISWILGSLTGPASPVEHQDSSD
jgi:AcrR family transcriptional regulator